MKAILVFCLLVCACSLHAMLPQEALSRLKEGNARFVSGQLINPNRQADIRIAQTTSQNPFCAILACADSRVAPEILFDQGIGDLFVVRLAGNVASETAMESMAFACDVLGVALIVVMGHQNCGAIDAVMRHTADDDLGSIAKMIQPAVKGKVGLQEATIANVYAQIKRLRSAPILQSFFKDKSLQIVGAYYDFDSGKVHFLEPI